MGGLEEEDVEDLLRGHGVDGEEVVVGGGGGVGAVGGGRGGVVRRVWAVVVVVSGLDLDEGCQGVDLLLRDALLGYHLLDLTITILGGNILQQRRPLYPLFLQIHIEIPSLHRTSPHTLPGLLNLHHIRI